MMGTAWLCDGKGKIVEVIRDDLNLCLGVTKGTPFSSVVDARSVAQAEALVAELLTSEAVFDWHMDVLFADKVTPLHFAGGVTDDHLLIMASVNQRDMAALERQLLLRPRVRGAAAVDDEPGDRAEMQRELTSLRAEVSRLERELVARNIEIEELDRKNTELEALAAELAASTEC